MSTDALEQNATLLESTLEDFGVRGEILAVRPGPVVTLYELEPAPGTKSSRVISLADDIARSMSAISARVAVVQGRNAIGIELPNARRETVYLRELLASRAFAETKQKLALCLGKTSAARRSSPISPACPTCSSPYHRLGQVGRHQHHDPVAALPDDPGGVPPDHGRSQDAGALGLRRHPAPALPRRHRPQEGGHRPQMGGARDGGALQEDVEAGRAQHRRLQRPGGGGRARAAR